MRPMRYANQALNDMTSEEILAMQEVRVLSQIDYCYSNSEFYRRRFADVGVHPNDVKTIDDYKRLPVLMDKEQERLSQRESLEEHGHGFGAHLCCSPRDLELIATTSGTTGDPVFSYSMSRADTYNLAQGVGYMLGYAGLNQGDRLLFAHTLGIYATTFMLPLARRAEVLPVDVDPKSGAQTILNAARLSQPDALMTTPSLIDHLIGRIPDVLGIAPSELGFRALFAVGELAIGIPEVRSRIQDAYGCQVYDWTAPMGQTLCFSCDSEDYHGMHAVTPDLDLYPLDLVDPETKQPLEIVDGVIGESMNTSLKRRALPVLRYATGDIIQVFTKACPGCGFEGPRMKYVGRSDDMLIVKGANVYPGAIKQVLAEFIPAVTGEMRVVLNGPPPRVEPPLQVRLEHGLDTSQDDLPGIGERIRTELSNRLKVKPELLWEPPGTLERAMTKTPLVEKRY